VSTAQPAHYSSAHRFTSTLMVAGLGMAIIGLVLAVAAKTGGVLLAATAKPDLGLLGIIGASLLIDAAGFLTTALISDRRHQLVLEQEDATTSQPPTESGPVERRPTIREQLRGTHQPQPVRQDPPSRPDTISLLALARRSEQLAWVAGWPQALLAGSLALLAGAIVLLSWPRQPLVGDTETLLLCSVIAFAAAFPVLVLERVYANTASADLPEAAHLARLSRVPLLALVGGGVSIAVAAAGFRASLWIAWVIGGVTLIVAAELLGRAVVALFLPAPDATAARSIADSSAAALIRFELPSIRRIGAATQSRLGIDLSRSSALLFVRRAALPVAAGLALFGWCLTGVTTLALDERGIYERMGAPVDVLAPGLHVRLPWPFGNVRRVEYGVIHEAAVVPIQQAVAASEDDDEAGRPAGAESPAPTSADRLWDMPHPSEVTYLIASAENGKQSFQVVNIDVRLIYRIGLSDAAALMAAYQVDAPEALVRAAASQLLARYFASHTLSGVLRESREMIAGDLRSALQQRLDELSSGIDVLQVVIEAIHPPQGAANAYHFVQAAEINARTAIAREQGDAIRAAKRASQEAVSAGNRARIAAAEAVGAAKGDAELFHADRLAEQTSGRVVPFERWLDRLSRGLSRTQIVLLDHRLSGPDAPTIDLRTFTPPTSKPRQ